MHAHARIAAYRLGLLEPSETLEVRSHLRACEECRGAFEPFQEISEEEERRPGHLPIALITRWDTFAPLMSDEERACLEAHFESCPRCTDGRAFARLLRGLPEREAPARRAWLGFGTAALAAVLAVAIVGALRERPSPSRLAKAPSAVETPAPARTVAPSERRAPVLTLAGADRGGSAQVVRVPKGATILPIRVPPLLGVGPDARIAIRVEGPGGVRFGAAEVAHRALFGTSPAPAVDARAPEGPLPAGHYRVTVVSDAPAPGGFETATYGFDLREE